MKSSRERIDLSAYFRALGVFARNPTVIVLPLLVGVIQVLVAQLSDVAGGGIIASLTNFLVLLLQLFALGVAIIIGDAGWRRGVGSFDDAWQDARRKGREILLAAFGFTFVITIAQYAVSIFGGMLGPLSLIVLALAVYGLIYTIAAAAIGGVPGGAAISVSIERVRGAPLTAAILTVVSLVLFFYVGTFIDQWIFGLLGIATAPIVALLLGTVVRAILTGYLAVVMAKVYSDVSFTMPRW